MIEDVIKYLAEHLEIKVEEQEDMYRQDLTVKLLIGETVISESSVQIENKM
jgi:energy-converting hydrogenase A subunit M